MRFKTIFLLFIIPLFTIKGNAQNVFPSFTDNSNWNVLEGMWGAGSFTNSYEFDGADSLCGYTYSVMEFTDFPDTVAYFRSDSLKAYYRLTTDCSDKEYLMYDYSMNIGDTVYVGYDMFTNGITDTAAFVLANVELINYFGINRKRFTVLYDPANWGNNNGFLREMYWIEGIGSPVHPFYPFVCLWDGCEYGSRLLCYDSSGVQLYQDEILATCDTTFLTSIAEEQKQELKIYPNPFNNKITVKIDVKSATKIELYDILGRRVDDIRSVRNEWLDIWIGDGVEKGIYLLNVYVGDEMISKLILKE